MVILNENIEWNNNRKTSSISSFGFTGTNSHCIIGYESNDNNKELDINNKDIIMTLSSKNEISLSNTLNKYKEYFEADKHNNINQYELLKSIKYKLSNHRSLFKDRIDILIKSKDRILNILNEINEEYDTNRNVIRYKVDNNKKKIDKSIIMINKIYDESEYKLINIGYQIHCK